MLRKRVKWVVAVPAGGVPLVKVGDKIERGLVLVQGGERSVASPVNGEVVEQGEENITVSFSAIEVSMGEVISGRVWGEASFGLVDLLGAVSFAYKSRILFTKSLNPALLMKAVVIGVVAIVVVSDEEYTLPFSLKVSLPIGWISSNLYQQVVSKFGQERIYLLLFNTQANRLLVVVE